MRYAHELPTIDATPERKGAGRPFLWLLLALLAATAAVGAWVASTGRGGEGAPPPAPPRPPTEEERLIMLESLAESEAGISEEDRMEAMAGVGGAAPSREDIQAEAEQI